MDKEKRLISVLNSELECYEAEYLKQGLTILIKVVNKQKNSTTWSRGSFRNFDKARKFLNDYVLEKQYLNLFDKKSSQSKSSAKEKNNG